MTESAIVLVEKTVPQVMSGVDLELYFGPVYSFDDGDPDYLPLHLALDRDIKEGSIIEGWFGRWRVGSEVGPWTGPFVNEEDVQVVVVRELIQDLMEA